MNREMVEKAVTGLRDEYLIEAAQYDERKAAAGFMLRKLGIVRIAAAALLLCVVGGISAYGYSGLLKETHISENREIVYIGSMPEETVVTEEENSEIQPQYTRAEVTEQEKAAGVSEKETGTVPGIGEIIVYRYPGYQRAVEHLGMDCWFGELEGETAGATASVLDSPYFRILTIREVLETKGGRVRLVEFFAEGNVTEDYYYSEGISQMTNQREYINKNDYGFTLIDGTLNRAVDEFAEAGQRVTLVLIGYREYRGELMFTDLSEKDMQEVLDGFCLAE